MLLLLLLLLRLRRRWWWRRWLRLSVRRSTLRHRRIGLGVAVHPLLELIRGLTIDASTMMIVRRRR